MRLRERTTADLLLLLLGLTVCLSLLFAGGAIAAIAVLRPQYPIGPVTEALVSALQNVLFTVVGVAAGRYMADPTSAPWSSSSSRDDNSDSSSDDLSGVDDDVDRDTIG